MGTFASLIVQRAAKPSDEPVGCGTVPRTADPVARWLLSKQNRGCLPQTIRSYRWAVDRTIKALRTTGRGTDPKRWTTEDALWLKKRFNGDPWQLAIVNDLMKFYGNRTFDEIGLPHQGPPRHVRWMSEETFEAILVATRSDPPLRLIALLGLGQGLRRIEWIRLRVTDFDLVENRLLVRGKGRAHAKLAWVALHPAIPEALHEYLRIRERMVRAFLLRATKTSTVPEELFIHPCGDRLRPYGVGGMDRWVSRIQRRLAARGIMVKLSSHMFRRSGATFLERALLKSPEASRDGVYRTLQAFLRHDNLATTMRYLEADPDRQRRAMAAFAQALPWDDPDPIPSPTSGTTALTNPGDRSSSGRRFSHAPAREK
jgi:integrase